MSGAQRGAHHFDWPLSRDEKKYHIMQLYDRELQLTRQGEALLECHPACQQEDPEHCVAAQPLYEDQLHPITEEAASPNVQLGLLTDDLNAAMQPAEGETGEHVHSVAERLRLAVADAVATLKGFESQPSAPALPTNSCAIPVGSAAWGGRRAVSEEVSRRTSTPQRRTSLGRRDSQAPAARRTSGGSRSRAPSIAEHMDSDGGEGDTEEPMRERDMSARRRRGSWQHDMAQRVQAPQEIKSVGMQRSRSVPPAVNLLSLSDFLGETVPDNPFP